MGNLVKQVLRSPPDLSRRFVCGLGERGQKGGAISRPAHRFIGIYLFHVPLLEVLLKVELLGSSSEGPMEDGRAFLPLPGAFWRESGVDILRIADGNGDWAFGMRCFSGTCNGIRQVDTPVVICCGLDRCGCEAVHDKVMAWCVLEAMLRISSRSEPR
jgi:hypothetical protein